MQQCEVEASSDQQSKDDSGNKKNDEKREIQEKLQDHESDLEYQAEKDYLYIFPPKTFRINDLTMGTLISGYKPKILFSASMTQH